MVESSSALKGCQMSEERFDRIDAALEKLATLFVAVDRRLGVFEQRLGAIAEQLGVVEERLAAVAERLGVIERRLDALAERLGVVEQRLDALAERLGVVEQRLDAVEVRLDAADRRADAVDAALLRLRVAQDEIRSQVGLILDNLAASNERFDRFERYVEGRFEHLEVDLHLVLDNHASRLNALERHPQ
jgi:chromosome segregation ATPase